MSLDLVAPRALAAALAALVLSAAPAAAALREVRAPRVTGTAMQGATLTAGRGTWSGRPTRFHVTWLACDARGAGCRARSAHTTRYRLGAGDVGRRMRARVRATARGRSATATSRLTPVVAPNPAAAVPAIVAAIPGLGELAAALPPPVPATTPPPTQTETAPTTPTTTTPPPSSPPAGMNPMPVISRGVPAFSSSNCPGPQAANDDSYDTQWTCASAPSSAAPAWLAYDLSGVPAARRGRVVLAWFNDPVTSEYDHTVTGGPAYNLPADYAVEVDAAPGGSVPSSGWTAAVPAVTGNAYNSRQHAFDLAGANWVRLRVTRATGGSGNNRVVLNMDVHDASAGLGDDWLFLGDSITQDGLGHDTRRAASGATVGTFSQLVNAAHSAYFPLYQDGGIGGLRSAEGAAHVDGWLALFPGRYVVLAYGTNDALTASPGDKSIQAPFRANMRTMARAVLDAGKVPVIPTIPWGANANLQANVPSLNAQIASLEAELPAIVAGPDLYGYFHSHQSLIGSDGVHPTWDAGYAGLRQAWAGWAGGQYP